jgi:hypothetical protein
MIKSAKEQKGYGHECAKGVISARTNGCVEVVMCTGEVVGLLTRRESAGHVSHRHKQESQPKLTIQARGIAHGGMSSLQKSRTVDRAVISKGIRRAS